MPMLTSTHPSIPLYQTFHPLSIQEAQRNVQMNAWSLLFNNPRGVLLVWYWASGGQFALCGAFSVSLFWGCSSRVVMVHLACLTCTTMQRWVPSLRVMRKHKVGRDAFCNLALHLIWFLLPLIFYLSPPPVGVSFSQDQVTWLQWNGISFPIVVPLLSLHLHVDCIWASLKALAVIHTAQQHSGQHTGVSVYPLPLGNRSQWVSAVGSQTLNNVGCIE